MHELEITGKPQDIPESIVVDVSSLEINDTVKIEAIRDKYSKIDIRHDDDEVIVVIHPPAHIDENKRAWKKQRNPRKQRADHIALKNAKPCLNFMIGLKN